jgi:hypothetical protein
MQLGSFCGARILTLKMAETGAQNQSSVREVHPSRLSLSNRANLPIVRNAA